jgi:hypothetical protein
LIGPFLVSRNHEPRTNQCPCFEIAFGVRDLEARAQMCEAGVFHRSVAQLLDGARCPELGDHLRKLDVTRLTHPAEQQSGNAVIVRHSAAARRRARHAANPVRR